MRLTVQSEGEDYKRKEAVYAGAGALSSSQEIVGAESLTKASTLEKLLVRGIFANKTKTPTAKRRRKGGKGPQTKTKGKGGGMCTEEGGPGFMRTSGQSVDVFLTTLSIINQIWSP